MELQFLLDSTDITQYVQAGSLSISRGINGTPSNASFTLMEFDNLQETINSRVDYAYTDQAYTNDNTYPASINDSLSVYLPLEIKNNGTRLFYGYVVDVSKSNKDLRNYYDVTANDIVYMFDYTVIDLKMYQTSTTVGAIVADLLQYVSGLSPVTTYIVDSTPVTEWYIVQKTLKEALNELAAQGEAYYYVDSQSILHWRQKTNPEQAGIEFSQFHNALNVEMLESTFAYSQNLSSMINKVTVVATPDSVSGTTTIAPNPTTDGYRYSTSSTSWPPASEGGNDFSSTSLNVSLTVNQVEQQGTPYSVNAMRWYSSSTTTKPSSAPYYNGSFSEVQASYSAGWYYYTIGHWRILPPSGVNLSDVTSITLRIPVTYSGDYSGDTVGYIEVRELYQSEYNASYSSTSFQAGLIYSIPSTGNWDIIIPVSWFNKDSDNAAFIKLLVGSIYGTNPTGGNRIIFNTPSVLYTYRTGTSEYVSNRSYLSFNTSSIPTTATINNAKLKLYCANTISSHPLKISYCNNTNWTTTETSVAVGDHFPALGWNTYSLQNIANVQKGTNATTYFVMRRDHNASAPTSTSTLTFNSNEGTNKPVLEVTYFNITSGIKGSAEDTNSIASYGLRHKLVEKSGLGSQAECEQLAQKILYESNYPIRSYRFTTRAITGVNIGSVVSCDFPSLGVYKENMLVVKVSERYDEDGVKYQYDLNTPSPDLITYLKNK